MKVLYIGNERRDAQAVAAALRGVEHGVNVSWAPRVEHAVRWLKDNQDLQAVVVEAQTNGESWPSILEPVFSGSQRPAVVVIVPDGPGPAFESLHPAVDDYIVKNDALSRDLAVVVTRAVARTHERAQSAAATSQVETLLNLERTARTDLEQRLAAATTALHEAERRHEAAIDAAQQQLAEREAQYEIGMARAAANWEMVDEQLRAAAIEVERARQNQAAAAAAVDRLSQREAELRSQLADAAETQSALERRLTEAETAVEAAQSRIERERLNAAEELAEQRREFQVLFEQEHERRCGVQDSLAEAVSALENAEKRHAEALAEVEAQSRQLEANLRLARLDVESKAADIEQLTARENDFSQTLLEVSAGRSDLERRLAATEAAFDDATARATRDRLTASKKAADREAELDGQLQQERAARATLEQTIADTDVAQRDTQQRHAAALAQAASDLAERQANFDRALSYAVSDRNDLAQRLNETELTLAQLRRDRESLTAALEQNTAREADLNTRLAEVQEARDGLERQVADARSAIEQGAARETDLDRRLQQEGKTRTALEQAVADAEVAQREALLRHEEALAAADHELTSRQANFDRKLSTAAAEHDRLTHCLGNSEIALDHLARNYESSTKDVERLTQHAATLTSELASVQASHHALEAQLSDAASAMTDLEARADRERAVAADREADLEARLAQEHAQRISLEQAIADAKIAQREAQRRHDDALTAAANELAEREAQFERDLSNTAADRDQFAQSLSNTESVLEQLRRDHESTTSDVASLMQREADLTSRLGDVQAVRDALNSQLAGATTSIADAEAALRDAEQRHEIALSTAASELAEQRAESARALSRIVAERDDLSQTLKETQDARDTLSTQLAEATRSIEEASERTSRELAAAAEREKDLGERLAQETESRNTVEQTLAEERAAAVEAERSSRAEADALRARAVEQHAQFEVVLAQEQLEHENRLAEVHECTRKLELERDALQQSLTGAQESSRQLQQTLAAMASRLEEAIHRIEALQAEADQLPRLREQADDLRAENSRLFEQAGLAMFRCTPYGALIHANRACATLVGRRAMEQPPEHFAAAVFEAPDALSWLIERCLSTRTKESSETTWRRNDGGRLHVRLLARLLPSDAIEVVVEDLTRLRVLEERLDQAHRMEAVGRFASEVAVTCTNLLSDIHHNGEQWLTAAADHVDLRQQGELLIEEVKRAADLLHQLATFGDEQARTPMLVDLNTLIRDLEPVLKRLAGNQVDIEIRDSSSPLMVDVQTERVERLLVNLASYGRERMPSGGRLRIDLGTEVVDRHFAAKHHNVRLGLHALITVTGVRAAAREGAPHLRDESQRSTGRSATRPGADFGTLQRLVTECGGHLWMQVQPAGDVVAKIRLPLQNGHDQSLSKALVARGSRERAATRWFQS